MSRYHLGKLYGHLVLLAPKISDVDKEITKQQIYKWKSKDIKKMIYKLSEIEYLIKKENKNSLNIVTDFILDQSSSRVNNLA